MKKVLFVLGIVFSFHSSTAQNTTVVKGVVVGATDKRPLEGISVVLKPSNQIAITDERGVYQLKGGRSQ
ncbi:MAG TPA: hypothetical protein VD794_02980, partial [Flavisolibacter sp.]|nr:hypothetical protein [Flavisolibacter sp.]